MADMRRSEGSAQKRSLRSGRTRTFVLAAFFAVTQGVVIPWRFALGGPQAAAECKNPQAEALFERALAEPGAEPGLMKREGLFRRVIEICPTHARAHNDLGNTYENQGRLLEAVVEYRKAAELDPNLAIAYFGLGDIYAKTNRPQEAIVYYEKGLALDPGDDVTLRALGSLRDIIRGGVIGAAAIRSLLGTSRGAGNVASITFGERLVPFDFDKYEIRSAAIPQLTEIGKALQGGRDVSVRPVDSSVIEVAGHADARGTDEYNRWLSTKRAEAIVEFLVERFAIRRERLIARGYGETVPLCTTDASEACHALNRRVELVRHPKGQRLSTRAASSRSIGADEVSLELGFFYRREGSRAVEAIEDEKTRLRSGSDGYFLFFRPQQSAHVYVLQEDGEGNINLLFPRPAETAAVEAGRDYWVPGFGKVYTLNDVRGKERIYLVATSWSLEGLIEGLPLTEVVTRAVASLRTRAIRVVPPAEGAIQGAASGQQSREPPERVAALLKTVEGEGGWVKVVSFWHVCRSCRP